MSEDRRTRRADYAKYAEEAFAEHIITPEQTEGPVRMWLCHKPGTGIYHFRVIAAPGILVVTGDVGDNILRASDRDLVPWLRGAVKSPDYLMEKIVRGYNCKEFVEGEVENMFCNMLENAGYDPSLAEEDAEEDAEEQNENSYIQNARKIIEDTKENWYHDYDDRTGHEFCRAFSDAGGDSEYTESLFDYDSNALWTCNCLKKFIELLDKE